MGPQQQPIPPLGGQPNQQQGGQQQMPSPLQQPQQGQQRPIYPQPNQPPLQQQTPPQLQQPMPMPQPQPGPQQAPQQMVQPQSNPNSTQNTLQIAEIRDGIVIMNDGSYRSVIMAQSINFDLMSSEEREAVEFSYQGFLNSLYFPVQILVRSQKVDIRPYIQKLEKLRNEQDNMLLAYLMEDYIGYIDYLAQETNIMDKRFYIVIPYFSELSASAAAERSKSLLSGLLGPKKGNQKIVINEAELEAAKTELRNRVQSTLSSLLQLGVQGIPLDTQELIELYYDVYNPDTATRQQLLTKADLNTPVVTKGSGEASQPHLDTESGGY